MEKVFPSQIDINSGDVVPLRPFDILNKVNNFTKAIFKDI